jgi:DNA polymerase-3 subunit gamma/tau
VIHRSLDAGSDPRQFARQIVDYLRNLLLVAMGNASQVDATAEARSQMARHAQALPISELMRIIQAFNQAATETRSSWQPALPLEMAFIEAITPTELPDGAVTPPATPTKAQVPEKALSVAEKPSRPTVAPKATNPETHEAVEMSTADASANQQLNKNWEVVLARVREQNPNLYGVVNSAKQHILKGNMLTIGLNGEVLKAQLEKPANLELVHKVLKQVMGTDIFVRVVLVSGKKSTPPPEVDSDGLVASALRDLGGEIVDIQ